MRRVSAEAVDVTSGAALLISPVRRAIVDLLADHRPDEDDEGSPTRGLTAAQLASALELHVTTVRFHLDRLVAAGLVSSRSTRAFGVGRPRKVYDVAPGSLDADREVTVNRALTELLAQAVGSNLTPAQAGEQWARDHVPLDESGPADTPGRWLTKVGRMIDVLRDWGYTADLVTSEGGRACRIDLVRCPFLELARSNPAVVCGVHRGLIKGVMKQLGEGDTQSSLEPFVEPELCQAHVRTRAPFHARTIAREES